MDESIHEVFLEGREVIGNLLTLPHGEGVVAVREDDGGKLLFIGEEVATMDVSDGDLMIPPLKFAGGGERKKIVTCCCYPCNWAGLLSPPLGLFGDNGSAGLNKIIVCEHQEVGEGCGTCPCPYSSGYEVL